MEREEKKVPDQPSLSAAQLVAADGIGREESKGPNQPHLSAAVTAGNEPDNYGLCCTYSELTGLGDLMAYDTKELNSFFSSSCQQISCQIWLQALAILFPWSVVFMLNHSMQQHSQLLKECLSQGCDTTRILKLFALNLKLCSLWYIPQILVDFHSSRTQYLHAKMHFCAGALLDLFFLQLLHAKLSSYQCVAL